MTIIQIKTDLRKEFDITELGEIKYMLGLEVIRDRAACTITLV